MIVFVSGHLDLTPEEFEEHYLWKLDAAFIIGETFVVGDARGSDDLAQKHLKMRGASVVVYHMFDNPRCNQGFSLEGGFSSDDARDEAMTKASDYDIAWVRPGREKSGTAKNLKRRGQI